MTRDSLLLLGRRAIDAREVLAVHAERLADRAGVGDVAVATYDHEPVCDLRDQLTSVASDAVYAVPMVAAHDHATIDGVPAALSYVDGDVTYCEPPGTSPAMTEILAERAASRIAPGPDASLILVGFGSSSRPYQRQAVEYHAARLRERSAYGDVLTCYLLQNPTVECVRYNVSTDRAVAVPLFLARSSATENRIPAELELDRGGIEYADPVGEHPRLTDAVHAEFARQRALATDAAGENRSFEADLAASCKPVAADGEGPRE